MHPVCQPPALILHIIIIAFPIFAAQPKLVQPLRFASITTTMETSSDGNNLADSCGENYTYDSVSERCCRRCEPGFGVALPCTQLNDTVCSACVDGLTYSPVSSHESVCRPCSHCPSYSFPMHQCNATHNTKCECVEGYYYQPEKNMCSTCSRCPPGEHVSKTCTSSGNTQCRHCPPNTFIAVKNMAESCIPCSTCRRGVTIVAACTATRDTQCADGIQVSHADGLSEESEQNLIVIYCVVFGILLASLIIYVLLKHFQIKSWSRVLCYQAAKSSQAPAVQQPMSLRNACLPNNFDSATTKADTNPLLLNYESSVDQLPACLIKKLEQELGGPNSSERELETFVRALHFSKNRFRRIKQTAVVNKTTVAREIFNELCNDKLYHIQLLIHALKRAKRVDLVLLVQKYTESTQTMLIV